VWPTTTGAAARTGRVDREVRTSPQAETVDGVEERLLGTGWVIATEQNVFWMQKDSKLVRKTDTESYRTQTRSFDRVTRVAPTVAGGFLAVHTNGGIEWVDPATLEVRGTTPTSSPHVDVLADAQCIYVTGTDGSVHAYDAGTGSHRWGVAVDRLVVGVASADGIVYVTDASAGGGSVTAIDRRDGTVVWRSAAVGETYHDPVVGTHLYVPTNDGTVYALDEESGGTVWTYQTATGGLVPPLSYDDERVFLSDTSAGEVVALDAETGAQAWSTPVEPSERRRDGPSGLSAPVSTADSVLVGASRGGVTAFDRDTGDVRWRVTGLSIDSTLAVTEGAIYTTASEGLVEIDCR
jgi:FOG: WD40-like repeat